MPTAVVLSHDWIAQELGYLDPWLEASGYRVTRVYREEGSSVPAADLLVVLGSPGSVAHGHVDDAGRAEVALVADWLRQGRPYLGVCFGAQVLALATGGAVRRMATPFHAYAPITPATDLPTSGPWVTWHNDGITAPTGSTVLGSLDHADLAFRVGSGVGLQSHVEVSSASLERMARLLGATTDVYAPIVDAMRTDDGRNADRVAALLDALLVTRSARSWWRAPTRS